MRAPQLRREIRRRSRDYCCIDGCDEVAAPETVNSQIDSALRSFELASVVSRHSTHVTIDFTIQMSKSNQRDSHPAGEGSQGQADQSKLSGPELQEAIRRRAKEIYEASGRIAGRDLANWAQAEAEIYSEQDSLPARKPAVVVKVEGVQYVGQYDSGLALGYRPGEFAAGDLVRLRFESGKMYVLRPSGECLETTIIARIS